MKKKTFWIHTAPCHYHLILFTSIYYYSDYLFRYTNSLYSFFLHISEKISGQICHARCTVSWNEIDSKKVDFQKRRSVKLLSLQHWRVASVTDQFSPIWTIFHCHCYSPALLGGNENWDLTTHSQERESGGKISVLGVIMTYGQRKV